MSDIEIYCNDVQNVKFANVERKPDVMNMVVSDENGVETRSGLRSKLPVRLAYKCIYVVSFVLLYVCIDISDLNLHVIVNSFVVICEFALTC